MKTLAIGIIAFLAMTPASAAIYTVTENTDSGDGVCDATCTLRDAITAADSSAEDDIVIFGLTGRVELQESISIFGSITGGRLTIEGPGAGDLTIVYNRTISIGTIIGVDAEVEINHLTITEGSLDSGGAIRSSGTLTLNDVAITNSITSGDGGAIHNSGTLTLNYATISNNFGEAASSRGGGIYNTGTLTVNDTTISQNSGEVGGGIYSSGTLTLNNSTVSGNYSRIIGGGIYSSGTLTLRNSTVSGNTCLTGGCGIVSGGTMTLNNSTVTNNVNRGLGEFVCAPGGGIHHYGPTAATLTNSIVAGNIDLVVETCGEEFGPAIPDVSGPFNSLGNNLIGTTDGSTGFPAAGDQTGTVTAPLDPQLDPLQDNGGPTHTHALLSGSPAIDAGNNSLIPAESTGDQRGFLRIVNGTVDIGAFEYGDGQTVIDIKPGKTPNSINPTSGQKIPVAILTADTFDATQVVWETVVFGPDGATESHGRAHVKDVDGDGNMDMLLHFNTPETGIACGDTEATLTGMTSYGQAFVGTDSIETVNCPQ